MLEGLISKDDLKEKTAFYDSEIARLTEEMNQNRNISSVHKNQIDRVKSYIDSVEKTSEINAGNTALYGEMLERIVILENRAVDFYLKCVPFGFRIEYRVERYNKLAKYDVFVNSFAVIS